MIDYVIPTYLKPPEWKWAMNYGVGRNAEYLSNIIEVDTNNHIIELCVPGYSMEDLDLEVYNNTLTIKGTPKVKDNVKYIQTQFNLVPFTRTFNLKEHVEVTKAELKNGILNVYLEVQVPEDLQPKKVKINSE